MTMQSMMNMSSPMPAGMPMQAMMPMMMATMTMKLNAGKAQCEFKPAQGMDKASFHSCCQMLEMMIEAGMPITMQAGNMAMVCLGQGAGPSMPMMAPMTGVMPSMMCELQCEIKPDMMRCELVPGRAMNADVFASCCKLMEKMMNLGMPMMMSCNGSPVLCCTV